MDEEPPLCLAEILSKEVDELPPVARGLLLHMMEFQATHNLTWREFAGAVGPVLELFKRLRAEKKGGE